MLEIYEIKFGKVKMLLDENENLFNTPTLMYYALKKEFDRKYLNPKLWRYNYGTKESIRSYDDLLRYLEKTEQFRDLDPSLRNSIATDNVHLVLYVLPLTRKLREDLIDNVIAGCVNFREQSHEDQLQKIKKYFEMKRRSGLQGLEDKMWKDIEEYRQSCKVERNEKIEDEKIEVQTKKSVKVNRKKAAKERESHDNKKSAVAEKKKSEAESIEENEKIIKVDVMKHKFVKNKKKPVDIKNSVEMVNNKTDKKNRVKKEKNIKREELLDMRQMI